MGAVAFQSFHSYIVSKIKTTTHVKLVLTNNPQKHILSGYEIAIKPCNVNKTWIGKTAVKTSENTKQNLKLKFTEP